MTVNVRAGVLTQPGSTGNQTITLGAGFAPQAIIMQTVGLDMDTTATGWIRGFGWATYRGGTVAQRYVTERRDDAAATMNVNSRTGTDHLCGLNTDADTGALDLAIELVSMADDQVVVNWSNLFTLASTEVAYWIIGGDSVTDALAGSATLTGTLSTATDVTVATGFGTPKFVFMITESSGAGTLSQTDAASLGVFNDHGEMAYTSWTNAENSTTSVVRMWQNTDQALLTPSASAESSPDQEYGPDVVANWPTDGFRMIRSANYAGQWTQLVYYLAVTGTFVCEIGETVTPGGTPPQETNLDLGSGVVPAGGVFFGSNLPQQSGVNFTHADLHTEHIGFTDLATHACSSIGDVDALGTSDCNRAWSTTVAYQIRQDTISTVLAEATAAGVGQYVRLLWSTTDPTVRAFIYMVVGAVPANFMPDPNVVAWSEPVSERSPLT